MKLISFNTSSTLREILDRHRGIGPGFHFLRYALALIIFGFHCYYVVKGQVGAVGYDDLVDKAEAVKQVAPAVTHNGITSLTELLRPGLFALVAAFFALSGFLVTGSALRLRNIKPFLGFRILRIFPALAVETLLSAVLLGAVVTTLSPAAYFSDPLLWRYLGNTIGYISLILPGVFTANPVPNIVNVNLWTLPGEFYCYAIMGVLMLAGIIYKKSLFLVVFALASVGLMLSELLSFVDFRSNTTHFTTATIVFYFFIGCLFFTLADKIRINFPSFFACAAAYYLLTLFHISDFFASFALVYCTLFVGVQAFPLFDKIAAGDYSYGIYLYGFPVQQSVMHFIPSINTGVIVFLISFPITLGFAIVSWNLIEKPALKLKKYLQPAKATAIPASGIVEDKVPLERAA